MRFNPAATFKLVSPSMGIGKVVGKERVGYVGKYWVRSFKFWPLPT